MQVRSLLLLAVCLGLLMRPAIDLMPAFVGEVYGAVDETVARYSAWLLSVAGISALFASLWLARRGETRGLTNLMLVFFLVAGIAVIIFGLQTNLVVGIVLIGIYSFASSVVGVSNMSLLQNSLQERMRGRVMGLFSLTHRAIPAVGAFLVGNIANFTGLPAPIVVGGVISLVFWIWIRGVAKKQDFEATPQQATSEQASPATT